MHMFSHICACNRVTYAYDIYKYKKKSFINIYIYITAQHILTNIRSVQHLRLHYLTSHAFPTYITLHYITLHYITLHYITLHYITLHYITLHYTTLHYTTLQYTTAASQQRPIKHNPLLEQSHRTCVPHSFARTKPRNIRVSKICSPVAIVLNDVLFTFTQAYTYTSFYTPSLWVKLL